MPHARLEGLIVARFSIVDVNLFSSQHQRKACFNAKGLAFFVSVALNFYAQHSHAATCSSDFQFRNLRHFGGVRKNCSKSASQNLFTIGLEGKPGWILRLLAQGFLAIFEE
jgi:hypothetical protein